MSNDGKYRWNGREWVPNAPEKRMDFGPVGVWRVGLLVVLLLAVCAVVLAGAS